MAGYGTDSYISWKQADDARLAQQANQQNQNIQSGNRMMGTTTTAGSDIGSAIMSARYGSDWDKQQGAIPTPQEQTPPDTNLASGQGYKGIIPTGQDQQYNQSETSVQPTNDPTSQAGGADAAAAQQKEIDKTSQQVADQAAKGGVAVPAVDTNDPASAFAARNQNINAGVGNPITGTNTPKMPAPLTEQQQKNNALDKAGQETFQSMNTVGEWYQSKSFLTGMMQMGLSLLDGKGYGESFAAASNYFDKHYGMEQRQAWADDLLKKGYDRQEIQQYIETGDSKILTSPQEREAKAQQEQLSLQAKQAGILGQQLQNEQMAYEQSPEMRQEQLQDRAMARQYKQAMMNQMSGNMELKQARFANQVGTLNINDQSRNAKYGLSVDKNGLPIAPSANVQSFIDSAQQQGASINPAQLSGSMVGDEMVMKNPRTGRAEINAAGMAMTVDRNGQIHQRDTNQMKADTAIAMNQIALDHVNYLQGKNLGALGGTLRSVGQKIGFRSEADAKQWVDQYNGAMEDAITQQLLLESGGKAVHKSTIEHAVGAAGKLSLDMSAENAQRVIEQGARILNRNTQAATANAERRPELGEVSSSNRNFAPRGERVQGSDGNWYVSNGGPRNRQSTWVKD